jgi:hypothetical protein
VVTCALIPLVIRACVLVLLQLLVLGPASN